MSKIIYSVVTLFITFVLAVAILTADSNSEIPVIIAFIATPALIILIVIGRKLGFIKD